MVILEYVFAAVCGIVLLFVTLNTMAKRRHARFGSSDVEGALEDLLQSGSRVEEWSLFLSRSIDDTHLESIRQRCITIENQHARLEGGQYMTDEGLRQVGELLQELREHLRET